MFFDHKDFFRPICSAALCEKVFIFWYSHMITNFEFKIFVIILSNIFNRRTRLNIAWFHFCFLLYLPIIPSILSICTIYDTSDMFVYLTLHSSDKSFSNNRLSFIYWIHFNTIATQSWLHWSITKLTSPIYPCLVWFTTRLIKSFLKCISDCNTFFLLREHPRSICCKYQ